MRASVFTFSKACALGNDFVMTLFPEDKVDLAKLSIFLADRRYGVGCDQVIFFEPISRENETCQGDFSVRFFNTDGSEAEACGNGTRCIAKFLMDQNHRTEILLKTAGGLLRCTKKEENLITVEMPLPEWDADIHLREYNRLSSPKAMLVHVGNPHLVCFVEDIDHIETLGPILETHLHILNSALPGRLNVGFVQLIDQNNLALRVWERGAGLTPACGTGACAAAVAAFVREIGSRQVTVHQIGGKLEINFEASALFMSGEAILIYTGQISIPLSTLEKEDQDNTDPDLYAGTIVSAQLSPIEEEEYKIWADFGELGIRQTLAALASIYSIPELIGKPIVGTLVDTLTDTLGEEDHFTLLGYVDEKERLSLISRPIELKNGEKLSSRQSYDLK